jgi:hypothetical protein
VSTIAPASRPATRLFWGVARCLALGALVPALYYNLDYSHGILTGHNVSSGLMVLFSAVFIEVSFRNWQLVRSLILLAVVAIFLYGNTKSAIRNMSMGREAASEAKIEKLQVGSQVASQRVALGRRIEAQVKIADWDALDVLEAALERVQNSDPRLWELSEQCKQTKGPKSKEFCDKVSAAKIKVGAARERDKLQAQLDKLPAPTVALPTDDQKVEVVVDAYVANAKALLKEAGYNPSDRLIKAEEALSRAFGFELLAAFGPWAWLMFIDLLQGVPGHASGVAKKLKNLTGRRKGKAKLDTTAETPAAPSTSADDIDRFIADELEVGVADARMKAGEIRLLWAPWCQKHGIDPKREDELWKRLRTMQGVKHDPNNNRPRYLGVRKRVKAGPTLVVNNA